MKKIYIFICIILSVLVALNIAYLNRIKSSQLDFQRDILLSQTKLAGNEIETTIKNYENNLTRIIFKNINEIYGIFDDQQSMEYIIADIKNFYAKYRNLISNISVYDNENNFLGFYINEQDEFVIDTFSRQQNNSLEPRDIIKSYGSNYLSFFPFFENNVLKGNVVVEIDLEKYLNTIFTLYEIEDVQWMWLLNTEGEIICSGKENDFEVSEIQVLSDSIFNEVVGIHEHSLLIDNNKSTLLSAYYPLNVIKNDFGIVYSLHIGNILDVFINKNRIRGLVNLIIFLIILGVITAKIFIDQKRYRGYQTRMLEMKMIIEHFPIGIMVRDKQGIIKLINTTGQKLLFVDKNEDLVGKNFDEKFLVTNKYLLDDNKSSPFDTGHFMHYTKEGNEIVVYLKDEEKQIAGNKYILSALIDVSPIEKSRKQEAAANQAKSDFLAKMSHEIRTPMNGIIGMVENLLTGKLSKDQKEQVEIIRKSSDLLMAIINDLLDFSKIEAGKMLLEEIPFKLSEELKLSTELFKHAAKEKGIKLNYDIKPEVPDSLIGDPFRLRQVISNLLSNSIKFTKEGEIKIGIELLEKVNHSVNLHFVVEDTGIGIPKDKLATIFSRYEQAGGSTSRKFGGTGLGMAISKQLVEMMHGEIFVDSPSGISKSSEYPGTRFSFNIELHSDEKLKKDYNYKNIKNLNQVTALILSKHKDETDNIHRVFDNFGMNFNYLEYEDNAIDKAIFHIEQKNELYQLIVIKDKPGYDGFALARQLKENGISDRYPIILISSNDKPGNYKKCKSLGIDYYLVKPYDSHEVFNILKDSLPSVDDMVEKSGTFKKIKTNLEILVAEDNIINQRVIQAMFKQLGYEITLAGNGDEAIHAMSKNKFDLVFMDLLMPEKDGLTATAEIRANGDNTTIIAMTASNEKERREEAFAAGMNDYATKPITLGQVKRLLIKWFSETVS